VAAVLLLTANASANSYTFSALPGSGNSSVGPGSTIGWGYSITNNSSTDWLVITGLSAGSNPNVSANPYFFDYPSIAPGSSRVVPYNPFSPYGYAFMSANGFSHPVSNAPFNSALNPFNALGLYQATFGPHTPVGTVYSGNFVLNAVWFGGDPDTNPNAQFLSNANSSSASYSTVVTPEPASLTLVGLGLFSLAFGVKKKKSTIVP
jgi:hypothetical protein